jgi:cytochrome c biogenesis protein CcmG, thiol:disulfide interchange protein DsbE
MRLPDILGVLGALVVGGLLTLLLLASALGEQPALPTQPPPTLPPLPTLVAASPEPSAAPTPAPSATASTGVEIGQRAPAIEVTLLDGSVMNTEDFIGQPMWINFMATWCPQCVDELPMMRRYQRQLDGLMTVLVVDVREDPETVRAFMEALEVDNLLTGVDEDGSVQAEWGAYALPVHFWLDAEGIVREVVYGGAPPEIFIEAITAVVPEFVVEGTPVPIGSPEPEE